MNLPSFWKLTPALLISAASAVGREPLGVVQCKDVPVQVEIVDTLPRDVHNNNWYRLTHYIRNRSDKPITLYYLARKVEMRWAQQGYGTENPIGQDYNPSEQGHPIFLHPNQTFAATAEDWFGDRELNGKPERDGKFYFGFIHMLDPEPPRFFQVRFIFSFVLNSGERSESSHSITTGWKTIQIHAPGVKLTNHSLIQNKK